MTPQKLVSFSTKKINICSTYIYIYIQYITGIFGAKKFDQVVWLHRPFAVQELPLVDFQHFETAFARLLGAREVRKTAKWATEMGDVWHVFIREEKQIGDFLWQTRR